MSKTARTARSGVCFRPAGEAAIPGRLDTRGYALYLDVDGTILELASSPEAVVVPAGLVPLLKRLSDQFEGALAFVSGRTIRALDQLFAPLKLPAIGVHGGEIRFADGEVVRDERLADELAALKGPLDRVLAGMHGVVLEDKHSAIALHYRNAAQHAGLLLQAARSILGERGAGLSLREGKCVIEIRPQHLTKGVALGRLMQCAPFCGRSAIYAGDDTTDEDAFELVNRHGGISIRVGVGEATPTAATYRLPDPETFRRWLTGLAQTRPGTA